LHLPATRLRRDRPREAGRFPRHRPRTDATADPRGAIGCQRTHTRGHGLHRAAGQHHDGQRAVAGDRDGFSSGTSRSWFGEPIMRRVSYRLPNPTRPSTDVAHRRAGLAEEIRAAVTVSGGLIRAGADALLSHIPTIGNQTTPSDAAAWAVQPVQLEHVADLVYA